MDTKIAIKTLAEYALEQILKLVRVFQQRRSWIENTQGFFFSKMSEKKNQSISNLDFSWTMSDDGLFFPALTYLVDSIVCSLNSQANNTRK